MASRKVVTNSRVPDPNSIPNSSDNLENEWYNQVFDGYRITEQLLSQNRPIRLVCVGAGAAGLQIAYRAERYLKVLSPNGPASHGSLLPILDWHTRYMLKMINKMQTENIKAFKPKAACVKALADHTHELIKRLVWSSKYNPWFKMGKKNGPVTAIYPESRLHYFEMLKDVRYEDYEVTYRTANRFRVMCIGYTQTEVYPDGDPVVRHSSFL